MPPALVVGGGGDTGSASAVLQAALASFRMQRDCSARAPGGARLILASSDDPLRAALVLTPPDSTSS